MHIVVPRFRGRAEGRWYGDSTMKVAVIGATGAVGREMIRILEERAFPVDELVPLASSRSAGRLVTFGGEEHEVRELTVEAARGVDVAFVSAGGTISKAFLPEIAAGGAVCIDNSSAFRMDPEVPLSVPEVNPEALDGWPHPGIIAVPNCTTITAVLPLGPLHRAATCTSLVLSSYQAVSGAGWKGTRELAEQVEKLGGDVESLARPDPGALAQGEIFAKPIAFNVVAKIGEFETDGFTGEESKMMAEPRKILRAPDMRVVATSVRVPVVTGHSVSMLAEFSRPISSGEARELLAAAPGVQLVDDPDADAFPSPLDAAGGDEALVGRIRQVPGRDDALALFSCADNLRKGAALDAIQIAEHLFT
jgi:aspartate-semialdehyde dehydrogenase